MSEYRSLNKTNLINLILELKKDQEDLITIPSKSKMIRMKKEDLLSLIKNINQGGSTKTDWSGDYLSSIDKKVETFFSDKKVSFADRRSNV